MNLYKYKQYAEDVVSGKVVACKWIKLACKRYLDWFERDEYEFRQDKADKVVNFIEKLRHFKDNHAGKYFILEPWQKWVLYNCFGFYHKGTDNRVIQQMLLFIARKNGKSIFSAAIALYLLIGEQVRGTQVLNVANNRKQAGLLFDMEQKLLRSIDPKYKYFRITRDTIRFDKKDSYATVLSSDASGLDGFGGHFICDESHEYKSSRLWSVLIDGQVSMQNPMAINCTTAGFNLAGYFLFDSTEVCKDILLGLKEDDTQFAAIYTLDEDDDWKDKNVWIKANPNLGVSVKYEALEKQVKSAINNPTLETSVKTKNFNMFCSSKTTWIPDHYLIDVLKPVKLEDYEGEQCYIGVDLSTVSDMSAQAVMIPPNPLRELNPDKFIFKIFNYLPETALKESFNAELYSNWHRNNHLTITSGNVIDYNYILNDTIKLSDLLYVAEIDYDTYNATQWAINATEAGFNLEPYSQTLGNFNKPTKMMEILIKSGKVIIDATPIIRWQFSNVELKFDYSENCKPVKSGGDTNKKIDGIIAMLEALGGFLANNNNYSFDAFSVDKLV